MVYTITIPGQPVPASRPRVTRRGTYYPKRYREWKQNAEKTVPQGPGELSGPLHCELEFVIQKAKTSKLTRPSGDLDNYMKAAKDVVTNVGGYWKDDVDVVTSNASKRFAKAGEEPYVRIVITDAVQTP